MKKRVCFSVFFLLFCIDGFSQDSKFIDLSKTAKFIDTLLIDRDLNNWSIRLLGCFEQQRFSLDNGTSKFKYKPNNPYAIGIGVGTEKLRLDFTFDLTGKEVNPTKRFDVLVSYFKKKHMVDFYYQQYQGFNVENEDTNGTFFRDDIRSISTAIRYMYMFHESDYSIAAMKTGLITAEKTTISLGMGGFILHNNINAKESIIPGEILSATDPHVPVTEFNGTGGGVTLGVYSFIVLPANFFLSINIAPGIGLMSKEVQTGTDSYTPQNPVLKQLGISALLGYSAEQYYLNFSISNGFYSTDFDFGNEVVFGYINARLVYGYKLKGKFKKNWKK
jgi:hypothetical protein